MRVNANSAPVDVLHECGLFRSPHGLDVCWAQCDLHTSAWSSVQELLLCMGHTALNVLTHDCRESLHSARVMVLPDKGASYIVEGAGSGRWSLWHPCATAIDWASASQLVRELPHSCK